MLFLSTPHHSCIMSSPGWWNGYQVGSMVYLPELKSWKSLLWKRSRNTRTRWTPVHPEITSTASSPDSVRYDSMSVSSLTRMFLCDLKVTFVSFSLAVLSVFTHYTYLFTDTNTHTPFSLANTEHFRPLGAFEHLEFWSCRFHQSNGSCFRFCRKSIFPQLSSTITTWCQQCWICTWQELKPPAQLSDLH